MVDKLSAGKSLNSSLGNSVKFREQKSSSGKSISFKPLFLANWEMISQKSVTGSDRMSDASMASVGCNAKFQPPNIDFNITK